MKDELLRDDEKRGLLNKSKTTITITADIAKGDSFDMYLLPAIYVDLLKDRLIEAREDLAEQHKALWGIGNKIPMETDHIQMILDNFSVHDLDEDIRKRLENIRDELLKIAKTAIREE